MLSNVQGWDVLTVLVSIILALSIHEAMHGYVAHWLGDTTAHDEGRLTLNPLAHIDLLTTILLPMILILSHLPPILAAKPVPFNPSNLKYDEFGAAMVGVAGPITNLILACLSALAFRSFGHEASSFVYNALIIFTEINVGFFVFNMIPIPPLDGSRLLYAFAPDGLREVMEQIEALGFLAIIFIFVLLFTFVSGPIVQIMQSINTFLLI